MRAVAVAAVFAFATVALAQQSAPRTVATTGEIMHGLIVPSSTIVFRSQADPPKTAADRQALRLQALMLAESGNLLMVGTRVKDKGDWMRFAAQLRDASEAFAKGLDAGKDEDAMGELNEQVYLSCEGCHEKYLPK